MLVDTRPLISAVHANKVENIEWTLKLPESLELSEFLPMFVLNSPGKGKQRGLHMRSQLVRQLGISCDQVIFREFSLAARSTTTSKAPATNITARPLVLSERSVEDREHECKRIVDNMHTMWAKEQFISIATDAVRGGLVNRQNLLFLHSTGAADWGLPQVTHPPSQVVSLHQERYLR